MQITRQVRFWIMAVGAAAFAAAGAAFAATKLHTSSGGGGNRGVLRGGPPATGYGLGRGLPGRLGGGDFGGRLGPGGGLSAASSYLGLTQAELFTQLRSGKTLAQVADATSGKSADGLISALVADQKQQLESAVSSGRLTRAQADTIESGLKARITAMVNGTGTFRGRGPGFGLRPDGDGGFGPPGGYGRTPTVPPTHI